MLSLGERIVIQMRKEGKEEGIKEGIKEGKAEGRIDGIIYVAKEMIKKRIPIKTIEEVTKLKEEEIEKIKAELASA